MGEGSAWNQGSCASAAAAPSPLRLRAQSPLPFRERGRGRGGRRRLRSTSRGRRNAAGWSAQPTVNSTSPGTGPRPGEVASPSEPERALSRSARSIHRPQSYSSPDTPGMAMQRRAAFVQQPGGSAARLRPPRPRAGSLHRRRGSLQARGGSRGLRASCGRTSRPASPDLTRSPEPPMTRSTPRRTSLRRALLPLSGLVLAAAVASPVHAQSPRDRLLVTPAWLAAHLNDPGLVILHVGDAAAYAQAHIPGARLVRMQDVSTPHQEGALMLEMLPAEQLRERLQGLGISSNSRIVVYYGGDWVSPSTRVVFTLAYAGLGDRTSLLDGGLDAWKEAGQAVTAEVPPARRGRLAELHPLDLIVNADWVHSHATAPHVAL